LSLLLPLLLGILLACLLAGAVFLACLRRARQRYRARVVQLTERERVATGLHDTLLQSMQGLILRFQNVSNRLPQDSRERATIEHILDQADEVLAEGRHQILALRIPALPGDNLGQAFAAIGQSLQAGYETPFRLAVSGMPRAVIDEVGEEIYCIVRELLHRAFQQAPHGQVRLELVYASEALALYVRDDGPPAPAASLQTLQARAQQLGGELAAQPLPGQGEEVVLKVPGRVCYQAARPAGWRLRLAAWLRRLTPPNRV